MLCNVIAKTKRVVRCHGDLTPSVSLKLMCKCGSNLSKPKINKAPKANPTAAGITLTNPSPLLISMAGDNKLQKLAAIITPPVKPSIPSRTTRFIFLKKKTKDAPSAVKNQVNKVAYKAAKTGFILSK